MLLTIEEIESAVGSWAARDAFARSCAEKIEMLTLEVCSDVKIFCRAKTNESVAAKLSRFNEKLEEMLDLIGVRIVTNSIEEMRQSSARIISAFGEPPTDRDMTIRGGTMLFPAYRDYAKRDWPGASPASDGAYTEGVHINRKIDGRIVEIQVMTAASYEKFFSPEAVAAFKARQAALYQK